MDTTHENKDVRVRYRIEVDGELPAAWSDRLGAHAIEAADGSTQLDIRVRDQAELIGRLRRIHDLNLQLASLVRLEAGAAEVRGGDHA